MDKNGQDTKYTRQITTILHFVRNDEKWKMRKIEWCEVGLKLAHIETKNVGENDLNPKIKYKMVRIENWDRTFVQKEWKNTGKSTEQ